MGVHARRAARWRAPAIAAAAGLGTVAALLVAPPAAAVDYEADPAYGGSDRTALGGYTDVLGVDAVAFEVNALSAGTERYVLGQQQRETDPRAIRLTRFTGAGERDTTFGANGDVTITPGAGGIPANTTVSHLVHDDVGTPADPSDDLLYIVGRSGANVIIVQLDELGAVVTAGTFGTAGVGTAPSGLPTSYEAGLRVVDVERADRDLVIAIQAVSTGGDRAAQVMRVLGATGQPDIAGFNAGGATPGIAALPGGLGTSALSVGGITVLAGGEIAGTAQTAGAVGADSQSVVFQLLAAGTPDLTFGGGDGLSDALETEFDPPGREYANEALGDLVEGTDPGSLVVAVRAGTSHFLARLDGNGDLNTGWAAGGVSNPITSACSTGQPELADALSRYWLVNDCGDTGEVFRFYHSGSPDNAFGDNGLVRLEGSDFGYNGSVTAEPITFDGPLPVVGAGTVRTVLGSTRYDVASWRLAAVVPPAAPVFTPATLVLAAPGGDLQVGEDLTMTATFTGTPTPTVRWEMLDEEGDWVPITAGPGTLYTVVTTPGTPNTSVLTIRNVSTAQHGTQYRVVATNVAGTVESTPATVAIADYPTITTQPLSESVAAGADNTRFTVNFTGNPAPTVQWQVRTRRGDWTNITGTDANFTVNTTTTSSTLTVVDATSELSLAQFRAVLTNQLGTVTSNAATLEITGIPRITRQPEDQTVDVGDTARFTVAAEVEGNQTLSYQWQWSDSGRGDDFEDIEGENEPTLVLAPARADQDQDYYQVRVTASGGGVEYSERVQLFVNEEDEEPPTPAQRSVRGDFTGDGKSDISTWRASDGSLWVQGRTGAVRVGGSAGDRFVLGNFTGDRANDPTVYQPTNSTFYTANQDPVQLGSPGDIPVNFLDVDGNGTHEYAVWRPSTGTWHYRIDGNTRSFQYGQRGDVPLAADFTGDGKSDAAVFRPSNGTWYVRDIANATGFTWRSWQYGQAGDIPVPADFDGDGTARPAVFRPSNGSWYGWGTVGALAQYGQAGDIPLSADFNGDNRTDIAVFRPGGYAGRWYIRDNPPGGVPYGLSTDWPTSGLRND